MTIELSPFIDYSCCGFEAPVLLLWPARIGSVGEEMKKRKNMIIVCAYCGKEVNKKIKKKGKIPKYCSNDCYYKAFGKSPRSFGLSFCKYCGSQFKETRDRPNNFCSKSCSSRYKAHEMTLSQMLEKEINEDFNKKLHEEYKEKLKELEALRRRIERERRCEECGRYFESSNGKKFCSDKCRNKVRNRGKEKRLYKNGKPDLSITLTKLYMRDKGVCQICGRQIDFDCDSNDDHYPSIDHIRPIAKGGRHEWNNVQLACRICNALKKDEWDE